ncbi:NAD(+) kinase [Idiomarina tyrosinivorans]|uniref:NAD kinase n=1 Tax=Idiomarina tyrosinivorans TaxID=1445662 RepID=A0A432ZRF3_9GAMM|nr:NAD(+) kinase [Idiomarina tyrosinivorans]RUO80418.1 NAD(+) kinase [Idiomarina tyrosinivorans]
MPEQPVSAVKAVFSKIALLGKSHHEETRQTLESLYQALRARNYDVLIERQAAEQLALDDDTRTASLQEIGEWADLAVVIGGDGNMLGAARTLCNYNVGVVGVNRGNLGFLTDISPQDVLTPLLAILHGDYYTEQRFLLSAEVMSQGSRAGQGCAINEVVLHSDKVAHMVEFEVYVDDQFVYSQRSDGIIVATPTGSTAYSLSGGGPILHPDLDAITLVPMFPHTLSSRPIVLNANRQIRLRAAYDNDLLQVSCDGHVRMAVHPGDDILIAKHQRPLRLIHPVDYSYYNVLSKKLGWGSRLF